MSKQIGRRPCRPCRPSALFLATLASSVLWLDPHAARASDPVPIYRVSKTVTLGAPDRWDYVVFDPASRRVFIAHGDEVTVVSADDGAVAGHIRGLPGGPHGIAIAGSSGRGYTDDGKAGEAVSFDLRTLAVERHIKAAADADAVVFDPFSKHVFVVNGGTGTLTVIDPAADRALAEIAIQGGLEFAVADGRGNLYVNGAERQELVRVDTRGNSVTARWPLPECTKPHGLAIDPALQRLFVSCVNNVLVVVDAQSGKVVSTLPIGSGTDAAAFDPVRKLVFSSNGRDGTITVIREIDGQTYAAAGSIGTAVSARTMAIDPVSGRLYVAAAEVAPDQAPGSAHRAIVPGSLKLLFLDPVP
ncbi:MAG TPA: YncE family protein [Steroidobacteraceae bacterium]|jgi:DNA-binding beta-propeller fold protein YncE|nr:YncE family protein [Steroidobacteraceae bacterium]